MTTSPSAWSDYSVYSGNERHEFAERHLTRLTLACSGHDNMQSRSPSPCWPGLTRLGPKARRIFLLLALTWDGGLKREFSMVKGRMWMNSKHNRRQTNTPTNKQTNKQTHKQTNTNEHTNKHTNKQSHTQTNKQ